MRWVKHMTNSRRDEKLSEIISKHGLEGYGFYWALVEAIAETMGKDSVRCSASYRLSEWSHLLHSHHHRVSKYLSSLQVAGLVTTEYEGSKVRVTIPKLLKYRDEYSARSGQKQPIDTDTERDTDTDGEVNREPAESAPASPAEMDEFADWAQRAYDRHPNSSYMHLAMGALKKHFAHDKAAREQFDRSHAAHIESEKWQEKGGAFVPPLCRPDGSGFVPDLAWKRMPKPGGKKQNAGCAIEREIERLRAEEERNGSQQANSAGAGDAVQKSSAVSSAGSEGSQRKPAVQSGIRGSGQGVPELPNGGAGRSDWGRSHALGNILARAGGDLSRH